MTSPAENQATDAAANSPTTRSPGEQGVVADPAVAVDRADAGDRTAASIAAWAQCIDAVISLGEMLTDA